MKLDSVISEKLWGVVSDKYGSGDYKNAILEGMYFLTQLIQEKSGLSDDGVALVGQAFGSNTPKIRITRMQTQSEKDIQKGTVQLLLGTYTAIRNPRSHDAGPDDEASAFAILVFLNYLIGIIDKSRALFDRNDIIKRIFDKHFVMDSRYALSICNDIPVRHLLDIVITVVRNRDEGNCERLAYAYCALRDRLPHDDQLELWNIVSQELLESDSDESLISMIKLLPLQDWSKLSDSARIRTEGRLIESIVTGTYNSDSNKCYGGVLGSWAHSLASIMLMHDTYYSTLIVKLLSDNQLEINYLLKFFIRDIMHSKDEDWLFIEKALLDQLLHRNNYAYLVISNYYEHNSANVRLVNIKSAIDAFTPPEDDLPF